MNYKIIESKDGTKKINFEEGYSAVIIPSKNEKNAVCLSSQIGCPMQCEFCRAGKFKRNLTKEEIIEQYNVCSEIIGKNPSSIVIMGIGEPMLNFLSMSNAIEEIHSKNSFDYKKITLSTSGIQLDKLVFVPYNVAISLHSPNNVTRKKLMPNVCSIKDILSFAINLKEKTES